MGPMAMVVGSIVEWGGSPSIAVDAILNKLETNLVGVVRVATALRKRRVFYEHPAEVNDDVLVALFESGEVSAKDLRSWKHICFLFLPAMAMLSLDLGLRY